MSCNLGKTRTRFTVNSLVFVILFWFLVENFKLSARTKDARDTRDAFLESVYPCISNARHRKIKVGIRFSFDTLFTFDFDVCVGIEENLVLNREVA